MLYDAVYLAAHDMLSKEVGRKAIVLITDGEDRGQPSHRKCGDRGRPESRLRSSTASSTSTVSFMVAGSGLVGGYSGEGVLKHMAEETGGRLFQVDRKNSLDIHLRSDPAGDADSVRHRLYPNQQPKGRLVPQDRPADFNKDLKVQVRKGYYALPPQ